MHDMLVHDIVLKSTGSLLALELPQVLSVQPLNA